MKTVMKKMFSLLLVAVMLVGVMPFAAFADGEVKCTKDGCPKYDQPATRQPDYDVAPTCTEAGKIGYYCQGGHKVFAPGEAALEHAWGQPYLSVEPTCTATGVQVKKCERCGETVTTNSSVSTKPHDFSDATCTEPGKCTVCGTVSTDQADAALGHDWDDATCTAPKTCSRCGTTEGTASGHNYGTGSICATCKNCKLCNEKIEEAADHAPSCELNPNYKSVCDKCGEEYVTVEGHDADDCKVCLVCWEKGDTGVRSHTTAAHCPKCNKTDGTHKTDCEDYEGSGSSKVKIHVNLYTSNTYTATKELVVYTDSSSDTIYYSVAEHTALIEKELEKQYPKYKWYGNVYEAIKGDDGVEMSESIGNGVTVYINAYSAEAMVLIAVHNTRTMAPLNDSYIQLHGKMLGETVTKNEVLKAVSKNYNVNSMRMYSEQDWEDYVAGKTINSVESLKITTKANHEPFYIDVYISGSAKTGSSSSGYTADSSNPKTGDTIFAPVAVMGLSVSALAVLLYLNKKRAF